MSTGYFDTFPTVLYANIANPQAIQQGDFKLIVNIWQRAAMLQTVLNNISLFYTYSIQDSDTPEIIAAKLYGDATLYWIVMFANQLIDPYYQWPLGDAELTASLNSTYGSVANAQSQLDHYEKQTIVITTSNFQSVINTYVSVVSSNVVSIDGYDTFPTVDDPVIQLGSNNVVSFGNGVSVDTSVILTYESVYDTAINNNEALRNIVLPKPDYAPQIAAEFLGLMNS